MQTKREALGEVAADVVVGWVLTFAVQMAFYRYHHLDINAAQNVTLVMLLTLTSIARRYIIRRLWDRRWWKRHDLDAKPMDAGEVEGYIVPT